MRYIVKITEHFSKKEIVNGSVIIIEVYISNIYKRDDNCQ
jgi:hypothetical protein